MANTISYAEKYMKPLEKLITEGMAFSELHRADETLDFSGNNKVHIKNMKTSGLVDRSREATPRSFGTITMVDNEYTLDYERKLDLEIDEFDISDTAQQMEICGQIVSTALKNEIIPEYDCRVASVLATTAITGAAPNGIATFGTTAFTSAVGAGGWTVANVFSKLNELFYQSGLKFYRQRGGLIAYASSEIVALLDIANEIQHRMEVRTETKANAAGVMVETRIRRINGVTIKEVLDDTRLYTAYDDTEGMVPSATAQKINVLVVAPEMNHLVKKFDKAYLHGADNPAYPGHYLFYNELYYGVISRPTRRNRGAGANNSFNKIDSIVVDVQSA